MNNFILFVIVLNILVVIYNLYMWFKVGIENDTLKKENKELKHYLNVEYKRNIRNNDKAFERIDIEDDYRKLLLEKVTEVKEYYEDEYSKKEMGTAERVRFVGIVYGLYEAISIINQIDEDKKTSLH